ncbi:Fe(3+)-siderophore ABC transporter permease [Fulvimarina endophytica]|uniref:Fe(3+)-siderophore ABC transporter permease n=1 Tax=Fulvimarina endophytica TaxID=2293836 RepID=A0A371XBC8_9HYPH|nr:iron chelate uptake ABC transporter family permease subunit [Fulvimarina endophytica]RFC66519.1 Fe(3+)-siderophore ABC transporter permease [Fulvimarina endophytica]
MSTKEDAAPSVSGASERSAPAPATGILRSRRVLLLAVGLLLVAALSLASLLVGARPIAPSVALQALLHFDPTSFDQIVIHDYRLPRTVLSLLVGAAFGVSGALIQSATRNPLADPGILGVNAGAAFAVTLAVGLFGLRSVKAYLWFALGGAALVTLAVHALGTVGRGEADPVRLVLAGTALSAVLGGIGSGLTLLDPQAFDALRSWSIGSVAGRDMGVAVTVAPFVGLGLAFALLLARPLNALALGQDLAATLGANVAHVRLGVVVAVTLLAGAGTAAAGPIGFLGLMVPHALRWLVGPDQRWIVALTVLYAPTLLLLADIVGRLVLFPGELEAGIVTALIGAPVLIALARHRRASGL